MQNLCRVRSSHCVERKYCFTASLFYKSELVIYFVIRVSCFNAKSTTCLSSFPQKSTSNFVPKGMGTTFSHSSLQTWHGSLWRIPTWPQTSFCCCMARWECWSTVLLVNFSCIFKVMGIFEAAQLTFELILSEWDFLRTRLGHLNGLSEHELVSCQISQEILSSSAHGN